MSTVYTEEMMNKKLALLKKIGIVAGLIIMVISLLAGINVYLHATQILSDSTKVNATITKVEHWQEEGKKGRIKDIYEISYTFQVNSKPYNDSFRTNEEKFMKYKSSRVVEVAYSNKNPAEFDELGLLQRQASFVDLAKRLGIIFVIIFGMFFLIGVLVKAKLKKKIGQPIEE